MIMFDNHLKLFSANDVSRGWFRIKGDDSDNIKKILAIVQLFESHKIHRMDLRFLL